ncbi:MAG: aminoglycoside phosphotransferase family protein [Halomonas sp.]|nr:aminoglycoside phosphotransferase family protein [Halomonas sp.]MDN6296599.1 aminoglycoside phosphotransferase family protein [Halomonas sp.]MDN6314212.1 aminoglycoside phosphotransferase family protein [Halomonas sp.]MDN6335105.1 aminoglycoside phosphotransferase family protein [Halomonas sp.]
MPIATALLEAALHHAGLDYASLTPMAATGLAHDHVWLHNGGNDRVARLPKQSQMNLPPEANLAYQAACYRRTAAGGHTPGLHAVLPPDDHLPRGGLVVEAIHGRPARLPDDLPKISRALASIHGLAVPPASQRAPLKAPADPWRAMRLEIAEQACFVDMAQLPDAASRRIHAALKTLPARLDDTRACLISFDAHPGNFLIDDRGRAVLVDLEKCRYGLAGFDLAHATLYTSTTWDIESSATLTPRDVAEFYRHWRRTLGADTADALADTETLLACRRAMWLWSLTWCAKWRAQHLQARDASHQGEDWSAELSDPALIAHVRDRVEHYLSLPAIDFVEDELDYLDEVLD